MTAIIPDTLPLGVRICQRVHDYEWFGQNGTRRPGGRQNPCRECCAAADMALDWFAGATARPEVVRAFKSGWHGADCAGREGRSAAGLAAVVRHLARAER